MLKRIGALSAEYRLRILHALKGHPGASTGDLVAAVGVPRNRLWPHLSRLRAAGLIQSRGQGRAMRFSVSSSGMQAVLADIRGLAEDRSPVGEEVPGPLNGEEGIGRG